LASRVDTGEIERVRSAILLSIELLSVEALAYVLLSPARAMQVVGRIAPLLLRLRRLLIACEAALIGYATTESKVFGELEGVRLPVVEALLVGHVPDTAWVADRGKPTQALAPQTIGQLAARLRVLSNAGQPTVRIEAYGPVNNRSFIVYVPGTQNLSPNFTSNPLDMKSNALLMAGHSSTSSRATVMAMRRAGIGQNDRVMLVGHSQGGLIAADIAKRSKSGDLPFRVEQLVTFGSPLGLKSAESLPNTLSIENSADLVPKLDLSANENAENWATLEGNQQGSLVSSHLMETYEQILVEKRRTGELDGQNIAQIERFAQGLAEVRHYELGQR
jgi:hypothetical protein